jgi:hypothetical protein
LPSLTYAIERGGHSHGSKRTDTDLYTFSDGEIWEVVTEWTYSPGTGMKITARDVSKRVNATPTEAAYEDFIIKLVAAAESQSPRQDTPKP